LPRFQGRIIINFQVKRNECRISNAEFRIMREEREDMATRVLKEASRDAKPCHPENEGE